MLSALRHSAIVIALGVCCSFAVFAKEPALGETASLQARHLATVFPGRMTGSPAEMLSAEYLQQQFQQWGYESNVRQFHSRYTYTSKEGNKTWQNVTGSTVIAAREGELPEQIIIMAHLDTYAPHSDSDSDNNLGGLTLQGMDDNASGLGVMLELAQRLQHVKTRYTLRFIATSGEYTSHSGAEDYLARMSAKGKRNTLLVINLSSLIVGDHIYFNSGKNTPVAVRKLTRDRALTLARQLGIRALTSPGLSSAWPEGTGPTHDASVFDKAGIPVLAVEATDWSLGQHDGKQQRAKSKAFPSGTSRHDVTRDNQQYLDHWLPGQVEKRTRAVMKVMLPLVEDLANPQISHTNKKIKV